MKRKLLEADSSSGVNVLHNNSQPYEKSLCKEGQWLVRDGSIENFTLAFFSDGRLFKFAFKAQELQDFFTSEKIVINEYELKIENLQLPTEDTVSKNCIVTIPAKIDLTDQLLGGYLPQHVNPEEVRQQMKLYKSPVLAIYRVSDTVQPMHVIHSSANPGLFAPIDENGFTACYEVAYLRNDDSLNTLSFKTYVNDPRIINERLRFFLKRTSYLFVPDEHKPKEEVIRLLEETSQKAQKTKCALVHLHRNKLLYPEEFKYLEELDGTLIISIQTPSDAAKERKYLNYNIQKGQPFPDMPGRTGCEIKHILSKPSVPGFSQKWIIITGHGDSEGKSGLMSGSYLHPFPFFEAVDNKIILNVSELTNFLLQCGYKSGDNLNILLYICVGGEPLNGEKSTAVQLAESLAKLGISSNIIACKTGVGRFDGYYEEDEIPDECMRFRVLNGGAEKIVVVTGKPGEEPEEKLNQYPNGFYITCYGLGDKNTLIPKLITASNDNRNSVETTITRSNQI